MEREKSNDAAAFPAGWERIQLGKGRTGEAKRRRAQGGGVACGETLAAR